MKIKLFIYLVFVVILLPIKAQNNVIIYKADEKLYETEEVNPSIITIGLHTKVFNVDIISHTFDNGTGTITFSGDVKKIGNHAFGGVKIKEINLPNSVTTIGSMAFYGCKNLTKIHFPTSLDTIESSAFCQSGLQSILLPEGLKVIKSSAFSFCEDLESVSLPNSIEIMEKAVFLNCSALKNVNLPKNITKIANNTFNSCKNLQSIIIPPYVQIFEFGVFSNCVQLKHIEIPASVTTMGGGTFYRCTNLQSITCYGFTPPICSSEDFDFVPKTIPIYVPADAIQNYKGASQFESFENYQPIEATPVNSTINGIIVNSTDSTVTLVWPVIDDAIAYIVQLLDDKNLLYNLPFIPTSTPINVSMRNGIKVLTDTMNDIAGYQYTFIGLYPETQYKYTIKAVGNWGEILYSYDSVFTLGTFSNLITPKGITSFSNNKIIKNGQLYISHKGKIYALTSNEIR